ncbi:MAG: hypothetical protein ACRD12_16745 [Acidimicrobiales bacterium]
MRPAASRAERRDRPLRVFGFDPSLGHRLGNHLALRLPFEPVEPGPVGRYLKVVDSEYEPVNLDHSAVLLAGGLTPSEFDVQFHQQMVYAVGTHTIDLFQNALGRGLPWPKPIELHPHSGEGGEAAYDRRERTIRFGWIPAPPEVGPPGQRVYSCLSFDTAMQTMAHALLDAMGRPEPSAWADGLAALLPRLHHLTRLDAVIEATRPTKGKVEPDSPLLQFAPQLTQARGADQADPESLDMVDAVLEALLNVAGRRSSDLLRITEPRPDDRGLHPDLSLRLAREIVKSARRFLVMCIRAVDYCPPGPVRSPDYLRALVTVSSDFSPDRDDDRAALIAAFCERGLRPLSARSYAEEGVRWSSVRPDATGSQRCVELDFDRSEEDNTRALEAFLGEHRAGLGLDPEAPVTVEEMPDRLSDRLATNGAVLREAVVTIRQGKSLRANVLIDEHGTVRYVIGDAPPRPVDDPLADDRPVDAPTVRPLGVYGFDPSQGQQFGNLMTFLVPYEPLRAGPIGAQLAVIDYDPANDKHYEPVDLEQASTLGGGVEVRDDDPQFHQQMVYAVAAETIRRFEFALGRKVEWAWKRDPEALEAKGEYGDRLRILPHGLQGANAFYDGTLGALLFGYFLSQPGNEIVFTCLSHDIVAHETTHALVDNVRPRLLMPTGPDVLAFHEAFADVVALLQHFSYREALYETVLRTGGQIHAANLDPEVERRSETGVAKIQAELTRTNPLVEMAKQFGEALGTRKALREAIGTAPNEYRLATVDEPHERGSILVAAVFDAYFTVYVRRTADLLRMARAGRGVSRWGDLHPDLAARLTREASKAARHFLTICVRALDYLPPVDITFGDFLRAIVTSDADIVPEDPWKYRATLIDAFRSRGIHTEGVAGTSEPALRWPAVVGELQVEGGKYPFDGTYDEVRARLLAFAEAHRAELGLVPDVSIAEVSFDLQDTRRVDPSIGLRQREFVAQFVQVRPEGAHPLMASDLGGSTVLFWGNGRARYVISRPLPPAEGEQAAFAQQLRMKAAAAPFTDAGDEPLLAQLHRGW